MVTRSLFICLLSSYEKIRKLWEYALERYLQSFQYFSGLSVLLRAKFAPQNLEYPILSRVSADEIRRSLNYHFAMFVLSFIAQYHMKLRYQVFFDKSFEARQYMH